MITVERLKELLSYDPETGEWRWRVNRSNVKAGDIAGTINSRGYRWIDVDGRSYKSSRLTFLYMTGAWPKNEVDHRDTNRANDAWANLREATHGQNQANRRPHRNNKLGVKGVCRLPNGKYQASIRANGKTKHLGTTDNLKLAGYLYQIAAAAYHGEFARAA